MKGSNLCIIELSEWQEEEQGLVNLLEETMAENFPNLGIKKKIHTSTESLKQDEHTL